MAEFWRYICMCGTILLYPISDKETLEWNCNCGNSGSIRTIVLPIEERGCSPNGTTLPGGAPPE